MPKRKPPGKRSKFWRGFFVTLLMIVLSAPMTYLLFHQSKKAAGQ